jgi:predicted DNA-binding transcriptional regulator AlpA
MSSPDDDDGKRTLPIYVRFHDLTAAGIVGSWTQLLRMIEGESFPPGVLLSANIRAWRIDEIEHWLSTRPTARKMVPPPVKKPRGRKQQEAEAAA